MASTTEFELAPSAALDRIGRELAYLAKLAMLSSEEAWASYSKALVNTKRPLGDRSRVHLDVSLTVSLRPAELIALQWLSSTEFGAALQVTGFQKMEN